MFIRRCFNLDAWFRVDFLEFVHQMHFWGMAHQPTILTSFDQSRNRRSKRRIITCKQHFVKNIHHLSLSMPRNRSKTVYKRLVTVRNSDILNANSGNGGLSLPVTVRAKSGNGACSLPVTVRAKDGNGAWFLPVTALKASRIAMHVLTQ
jgi:hypothetical protein